MQNGSKWIGQISAEESVSEAAMVTLQARLAAVVHLLNLAANHSKETSEHVHQLRVYTRRSLAAVRMYEKVLPKKEAKWLRKWLRRIRKAAGDARDLDVFLQRYETQKGRSHAALVRHIKKRRRRAQHPIRSLETQLISNDRFEKHVRRLLKSVSRHRSRSDRPLQEWAQDQLARTSNRFFTAIPSEPNDLKALHRFRVRGKQLRYTMELFSSLFPTELRSSIYPLVTELQDRLGEMNDHATACRHLESWCDDADSQREVDHLRRLIWQEREQLEESIERFSQWWTPKFASKLESSLRTMTTRADSATVIAGDD